MPNACTWLPVLFARASFVLTGCPTFSKYIGSVPFAPVIPSTAWSRTSGIETDRRLPLLSNLDWPGFDAKEVTDKGTECSHGSTSLSAGNCGERVFLFGIGALVDDEADGPVAFTHLFRRASDNNEIQSIERARH